MQRSAIVPYSPSEMFDLVADIASYPEFLPWCAAAEIHSETTAEVRASLTMAHGVLNGRLTTRNVLERPRLIRMELEEGPFRDLHGDWRFATLAERGCEVDLQMEFRFATRVQDLLAGAAFELICSRLVDAFVNRARLVYG